MSRKYLYQPIFSYPVCFHGSLSVVLFCFIANWTSSLNIKRLKIQADNLPLVKQMRDFSHISIVFECFTLIFLCVLFKDFLF